MKLLALEALVPENEAVALPDQQLQFVAPGVDEHEQCSTGRILLNDFLRQNGQPVDLPTHIDWRTMQVHLLDTAIRSQHPLRSSPGSQASSPVATAHTRSHSHRGSRCNIPLLLSWKTPVRQPSAPPRTCSAACARRSATDPCAAS